MQKLRRQAHEALSKAESADRTNPAATELDRLGGKTHLISPGSVGTPCSSVPSPSSSASSPSNTLNTPSTVATPPYDMFAGTNGCAPVPSDQIHPTIISDMRTFEGFASGEANGTPLGLPEGFNKYDLSRPFPLPKEAQPIPEFSGFQDIPSYFIDDFFSSGTTATSAAAATTALPSFMTPNMGMDLGVMPPPGNVPVPVLDATWQSFVEQLGF